MEIAKLAGGTGGVPVPVAVPVVSKIQVEYSNCSNTLRVFLQYELDYNQWHKGLGIMVPKKGDLSDPNKWRGINLMDVCSKIFSCILNERLYVLLDRHGIKTQFGATPDVGCQDGSFTIKSLLHLRHQHNLPTFVAFVDLVKAYDTTNHQLLIEILRQYGAPPKLCNAIERMYRNLSVIIKVGSEKREIEQTVGVRQGDNLSPVLFLFMMSAFAETLENE